MIIILSHSSKQWPRFRQPSDWPTIPESSRLWYRIHFLLFDRYSIIFKVILGVEVVPKRMLLIIDVLVLGTIHPTWWFDGEGFNHFTSNPQLRTKIGYQLKLSIFWHTAPYLLHLYSPYIVNRTHSFLTGIIVNRYLQIIIIAQALTLLKPNLLINPFVSINPHLPGQTLFQLRAEEESWHSPLK